ncbi:50S ribosomal protein L3 N(5)-glutamine methyltransferase [Congregibacter brevis]|uniref:50S ribosomal protein L3 N(5)-glutamine methyltransferase n=1 Tax=Congregibacter brevis TaxID=3081201 RepID=A0ABZ0I9I9_9GAMM|nr:50S ribosomal protein L3 N(5)-glutamine methyltransferase [Congregibacter sp. IMCC45268]
MVATSSGRSNATFFGDYGLSERAPVTLGDALDQTYLALQKAEIFFGHGSDSAWDEAVFLLLSAVGQPLESGDEVLALSVADDEWERVLDWLHARIIHRRPLPYLTGRAWFAGLEFKCDERALVPRSPIAEVIRNGYSPWWTGEAPTSLLDLCCGGGCIGIAAAAYQEDLKVVIADIDADALSLARENIDIHELTGRVTAVKSDLMDELAGQRFDIILTNPPYVDSADLASMPAEFLAEPPQGLGSGDDGLDMARRILQDAGEYLTPGGLLFLEVGNSWEALDAELSGLSLTWIEFSEGGHGVLLARAEELPEIVQALAR